MKKFLAKLFCFALCICLFSCKKDKDTSNPDTSSTFTAKINGTIVTFTVESSTLLRDAGFDEKRLDITELSGDGKLRLILTVGEETAIGNNVLVQDNAVTLFNDDNPNTPEDESDIITNAFFTLSTSVGNNWYTDVDAENGHIIISGNNTSSTTGTVTGSFNGTLVSKLGGTNYTITEGSFINLNILYLTNISYIPNDI